MKCYVHIRKLQSPYDYYPWTPDETPLRHREVRKAIERGILGSLPIPRLSDEWGYRECHVARVAYLVLHPAQDPIGIEVCPTPWGEFQVMDGLHRIAAALYRRERRILAELSGFVDSEEAQDLVAGVA